jgi:hypothetical protein
VRDIDIIAAVSHRRRPLTSTGSLSSKPTPYRVNIMHTEQHESSLQQGGLASGTGQTGKDEASSPAITAVANPHTDRHSGKDPYFENAPSDVSCKVVPGESHFGMSKVREATYFEKAFKIR